MPSGEGRDLGFGYSLGGTERKTVLPSDIEEKAEQFYKDEGGFASAEHPEDEYTEPRALIEKLGLISGINEGERQILLTLCKFVINYQESGGIEDDDYIAKIDSILHSDGNIALSGAASQAGRSVTSRWFGLSPFLLSKYLQNPNLVAPEIERQQEIMESGYQIIEKEISGTIFKIKILYDKFGQRECELTLSRGSNSFSLNSILPRDAIFIRSSRGLAPQAFGCKDNFRRPKENEEPPKDLIAVLFGEVGSPKGIYILFHEIGHALDTIKHGERQKMAEEQTKATRDSDRKYSESLDFEIDAQRERSANAWAITEISKLRDLGIIDPDVYTNDFLRQCVRMQLYNKYDSDISDGYHPYLRTVVEKDTK